MKPDTHPELYNVKALCACGNMIETTSTVKEISIAICSKCHPFFTGKHKLIDTAGRVERFRKKYAKKG